MSNLQTTHLSIEVFDTIRIYAITERNILVGLGTGFLGILSVSLYWVMIFAYDIFIMS